MPRRSQGPNVSFFAFQDIITSVVGIFILITLILVLELAQRVEAASSAPKADLTAVHESIASLQSEIERMEDEMQNRVKSQQASATLNEFNRAEQIEEAKRRRDVATKQLKTQLAVATQENDRVTAEAAELEDERELIKKLTDKLRQVQDEINRVESDESPVYRDVTEQGRFLTLIILDGKSVELRDAMTKSSETFMGARRLNSLRDWLSNTELSKRQLFVAIRPGGSADFEAIELDFKREQAVYGFDVIAADAKLQLGFELKGTP
jgi:hypothetical protein